MTTPADSPAPADGPDALAVDQQEPAGEVNPAAFAATDSGVQVVSGRLETEELAAIAVVVSAMSVTSRLEAEERMLAEGHSAGAGVWNDPVHCHPRTFEARNHCSDAAWQFSHR